MNTEEFQQQINSIITNINTQCVGIKCVDCGNEGFWYEGKIDLIYTDLITQPCCFCGSIKHKELFPVTDNRGDL